MASGGVNPGEARGLIGSTFMSLPPHRQEHRVFMKRFIEEQIAIYQAGIAEIVSRRRDLTAEEIHPTAQDEDARSLIAYRASLRTLRSVHERLQHTEDMAANRDPRETP